jgi:LmbE family N-acetylglucosaminyl deacetylase
VASKRILSARNLEALGAAALAEQALEILDGATEEMAGSNDSQWHDCRIAVRVALDCQAEAQEMRWQWFNRSLSIPHLRDYLQRLDDFEDVDAEERALQVAEHLRSCEQLAARFDNWQGHPDHTTSVERLYDSFWAKWGVWKLAEW